LARQIGEIQFLGATR